MILVPFMKKILIVEDEYLVSQHIKSVLRNSGFKVCGVADNVGEALSLTKEHLPDLVLVDIQLKGELSGIDFARSLASENIPFVFLTANFEGNTLEKAKETLPLGFIVKPFREFDLLTTLDVAFYRHQHMMDSRYKEELDLDRKLRAAIDTVKDEKTLLIRIAEVFQPHIPFDYFNIVTPPRGRSSEIHSGLLRVGFEEYQYIGDEGFRNIAGQSQGADGSDDLREDVFSRPKIYSDTDIEHLFSPSSRSKLLCGIYDLRSAILFPVETESMEKFRIEFYNRRSNIYSQHHLVLLNRIQAVLHDMFSRKVPVSTLKTELKKRGTETAATGDFDGMVGTSSAMLSVLDKIEIVAPLDTSVLILGESGTGKERVARSIHVRSGRKDKPFVIVNCASLPINLVESELFGHEKGAFTGAVEKREGKFEIANGGTIFLDEIGELTMDVQVKLLRVLQEQEIDRIGGRAPIKIDVRILAATNRDLEIEMENGRFRLDLYYRLFVFPVSVPALRERVEDIVLLTDFFVTRYAQRYKKAVTGVSEELLEKMMNYTWPGNVRELEHFIERSLLMTKGTIITDAEIPKQGRVILPLTESPAKIKTIDENEREYIISVLSSCNGKIRGINGAAALMGLPPTTLHSKMKRLGIR
ncbi:response regulator [Mucilaginibacter conchicola]|uniref:Response regulator n=2 Tax=Mucilaginibacter conchicola TaxID=2303333 RepID=A0A372NSA8_9SPHI|nr:response regulator [Mucilaginibacter conchicola]